MLIKKITTFLGAIKYVDADLVVFTEGKKGVIKMYKLMVLCNRYPQDAEMLAA